MLICSCMVLSCEKGDEEESVKDEQSTKSEASFDDEDSGGDDSDSDSDDDSGDDNGDDSDDDTDPGNDDDYNDDDSGEDTLTVHEFIYNSFGGAVYVKGYIIGDCTVSFSNAEFEPEFTHPQALLLADDKEERNEGNIISIQLKNGSKARSHMNLVDNPDWWGKEVVFLGYRGRYLGLTGIRGEDLMAYPLYDP